MIVRWVLALGAAAGACGGQPDEPAAARAASPAPPPAAGERPAIVFLGTSLTAGYGLDPEEAYPALIQQKIDAAGLKYRVVNAGVSGETSAGARRRVGWLLRQRPALLVVETGANDGLRGQSPEALRENVQAILDEARRADPPPRVVLVGMLAPPNYGADYARRFAAVYPELARRNGVPLVRFLLRGVAGVDTLNLGDAIHPNAVGQRQMAETVWAVLEPVLREG